MTALAVSRTSSETIDECRAILNHHAKSFRWAAVFLTPQMQDDAAIAYAFCRIVDDAVDEAPSLEEARSRLNQIEHRLRHGGGTAPIVAAYIDLAERAGFGLSPAQDLILGARSDLGVVRLKDDEEFFQYCYRVAGTVGLMMCGILGVTDPDAHRPAIDLGIGMQITNICRDVLEDAQRGRVYLPETRLAGAGISQEEIVQFATGDKTALQGNKRKQLARVVEELLAEADTRYRSAAQGFRYLPPRARLAIMVASHLYRNIGVQLHATRHSDPLLGRVSVSPSSKIVLTLQASTHWVRSLIFPRSAPTVGQLQPHSTSP